uniref:Uncharacterized protein n=1 Tax=Medicago truncatula TaxID=3880 RepID=B7FG60_MEDTR|nr:unknown [Medicago truncatula]
MTMKQNPILYVHKLPPGTTKGGEKLGYETEALAVYDLMRYIKPPIFTLCVGNAWGRGSLTFGCWCKG